MKINVVSGVQVWKSPDGKVKIFDITLDNGTRHQTKSEKIAGGGEFDVEIYDKNGRSYVRQMPKEPQASGGPTGDRQFKADPASRESIEWQTSLKAAVEVVRDYYLARHDEMPSGDNGLTSYAKEVDKVAVHFKNLITLKPTSVTISDITDVTDTYHEIEQALDSPDPTPDELPPVELYE